MRNRWLTEFLVVTEARSSARRGTATAYEWLTIINDAIGYGVPCDLYEQARHTGQLMRTNEHLNEYLASPGTSLLVIVTFFSYYNILLIATSQFIDS